MPALICVDLETTGLNPKQDRIIEIGCVKTTIDSQGKLGSEREYWESFVNPGRKLEPHIVELTGICDQDLAEAPTIETVLPQLFAFMEQGILLGHSVLFDYSFLKKAAVNEKKTFERQGIDTLKIARKFLPQLESRSLDALCVHYGIPHKAHRALADAKATVALYEKMYGQFYGEERKQSFVPAALHFAVKRDTPATKHQLEQLERLIKLHHLEDKPWPEKMTRSEASRYTDQILATFGR